MAAGISQNRQKQHDLNDLNDQKNNSQVHK